MSWRVRRERDRSRGRPPVGPPFRVRLPACLLAQVDRAAAAEKLSRSTRRLEISRAELSEDPPGDDASQLGVSMPGPQTVRDGVPLPGRSPEQLLSQLAYRVFGPLGTAKARAVLDYHGAAGAPAQSRSVVAARYGVTADTVSNWTTALRAAGRRQPLTPDIAGQLTRRSTPAQDHQGRVRIATAFGLPPPRPASSEPPATQLPASDRAAADTAIRVMATIGPTIMINLLDAVSRSRRFKSSDPPAAASLAAALRQAGAEQDEHGYWHPPAGTTASPRYRAIADALGRQELTRQALIEALIGTGYAPSSARGRTITTHPLIQHTGPDRYRLLRATPVD